MKQSTKGGRDQFRDGETENKEEKRPRRRDWDGERCDPWLWEADQMRGRDTWA